MKRIVLMVFMVMFLGMFIILGRAAAFKELDMKKLGTTGDCPQCDLSGADLSWAHLSGATWTDGSICKSGSVGQCIK